MADLIVYTLAGCPYCKKVMENLKKQGTPFQEVCLSADPELRKKVKDDYKADRVPVIVKDGKVIQVGDESGGG